MTTPTTQPSQSNQKAHAWLDTRPSWAYYRFIVESLVGCDITRDWATAPNVLLYGPAGFPHDFLWRRALTRIYKLAPHALDTLAPRVWNDVPYEECAHCFRLRLDHPDMPRDLDRLIEFVKHVVSTQCLTAPRHVIVLEAVDTFHIHPQAFRVLLERYAHNAWFVCTTHHFSIIEAPLLSRFHSFRVPLLSERDVKELTGRPHSRYWNIEPMSVPTFIDDVRKALASKAGALVALRTLAYHVCHESIPFRVLALALIPALRTPARILEWTTTVTRIDEARARSRSMRAPLYYEWVVVAAAQTLTNSKTPKTTAKKPII